jgi:hypothetical protein
MISPILSVVEELCGTRYQVAPFLNGWGGGSIAGE